MADQDEQRLLTNEGQQYTLEWLASRDVAGFASYEHVS